MICLVNKGLSDVFDVPVGPTRGNHHIIGPIIAFVNRNYFHVVCSHITKNLLDLF